MTRRPPIIVVVSVFALLGGVTSWARAEPPARYCRRVGTDDTTRAVPPSLAPEARRLFDLAMPDAAVGRTSLFRCMEGRVMVCDVGANLPCGKANVTSPLPSAEQYCREHPGRDAVPMYVTGHDTIYHWRCEGASATVSGEVEQVDERGFFRRYWRRAR